MIFSQDFDMTAVGVYGVDALAAGWMGASAVDGVRQGRTRVIEGADAHQRRSLRVLYPKGGVGSSAGGALWRMRIGRFDDPAKGPHIHSARRRAARTTPTEQLLGDRDQRLPRGGSPLVRQPASVPL
jgi:hypothetical protein